MPDPLLTSLCSICHMNPHRYRCPRCSTLTCSLPCIKRHKQWAQCNGMRDPAVYKKRADLATARGIDHDYNYLTSLERELDRAERDATLRGVLLEQETSGNAATRSWKAKGLHGPEKGEVPLKAALERSRVIVARAPKGMARSKQNETHWMKKRHCLQWTIEWVHPDGRKEISSCSESLPLSEAYGGLRLPMEDGRPKKKRKPSPNEDGSQKISESNSGKVGSKEIPPNSATTTGQSHVPIAETSTDASLGTTSTEAIQVSRPSEEVPSTPSAPDLSVPPPNDIMISPPSHVGSNLPTGFSGNASPPELPTHTPPRAPDLAFHLHSPSLPSRCPVLIPLPPDATLASCLSNRLVLEFPTVYVLLRLPDDKLPEGFISEDDFYAMAKKELIEEVGEGGEILEEEYANMDEREAGLEEGQVDERRLVDVLGKDLKAIVTDL